LQQVESLENTNSALHDQVLSLEQPTSLDKEALNSVQGTILSLRE
jgi:hypothetical protein